MTCSRSARAQLLAAITRRRGGLTVTIGSFAFPPPPSRPFLLDMALRLIPLALALCYCAKALATTPSLEDVQQLLDLSLEELIATPVVTA